MYRGRVRSLTARLVAGSLLLSLTLAPLSPAVARPAGMEHCGPASASASFVTGNGTGVMPCHEGDMSACTHALSCTTGPTAVLPAPIVVRPVLGEGASPMPPLDTRHKRLGSKPPTPPPNS